MVELAGPSAHLARSRSAPARRRSIVDTTLADMLVGVVSAAVRRIGVEERRARLGVRHRLADRAAATPADAARSVVALHATDPASVYLSVHARTAPVPPEAISRALYDERLLLRMIGMRRTLFVVPVELVPVVHTSSSLAIAVTQRQRYTRFLTEAGVGDGEWLKEAEEATLLALTQMGQATGAELSAEVPVLRTSVLMSRGKSYAAQQNITPWVLFMLGVDGRIVRGRPRGSWLSTQYRWSLLHAWLPEGIGDLPIDEARAELVRRWLAAFGPGTTTDLRWWTGWTAKNVKQALAMLDPVEVDLDGQPGLVLREDVEPVSAPEPWVALLPALDPTAMGWNQRAWYVGDHAATLFDRNGNIGPTVWSDGRIVGGWAQRADGEVVFRLLEDAGQEKAAAVEARAAELTAWTGPVRVTPRFRTPLERELTA